MQLPRKVIAIFPILFFRLYIALATAMIAAGMRNSSLCNINIQKSRFCSVRRMLSMKSMVVLPLSVVYSAAHLAFNRCWPEAAE
jgi:hypothetical protein